MKVWVTGAAGMLGTEVVAALQDAMVTVCASDREVNITDASAIACYLEENGPVSWIVNCAAWTAVDAAESHAREAFALNADGPACLAELAAKHNARMLHISTDYVFNGRASAPYAPDAPVDPCSVYGKSKLEGEDAIQRILKEHVIIRTAWLYGINGPNFVATMLRLMREREEIGVVSDQLGAPTYAPDLATAICKVVQTASPLAGVWHYTNRGQITWYDFAVEIQKLGLALGLLERACKIKPLTTAQYPTPATRPMYSVLDTTSFEQDWDLQIPHWRKSLENFMKKLESREKGR